MGRHNAANAVSAVLEEFDVGLVVCLGIAGALSNDVGIGDVCYAGHITDVLNNSKTSDEQSGIQLQFSPENYETPREIVACIEIFQTLPVSRNQYENWRKEQRDYAKDLTWPPGTRDGISVGPILPPRAISGAVVCGAVSASESYHAYPVNAHTHYM